MHISACTCVYVCLYFFTAGCFAWPPGTDTHPKKGLSFTNSDIQRGLAAEQYLMNGAEMAYYESEQMLLYRKPGNLNDAVADFRYLKPRKVKSRKGTDSEKVKTVDVSEIIAVSDLKGSRSRQLIEFMKGLMKGLVGDRDIALYIGQNLYPQVTLTKFDSNYRSYSKTFWYIGSSEKPSNL